MISVILPTYNSPLNEYKRSKEVLNFVKEGFNYTSEINDEFLGIYVLMEKIKRDKNRVDISKNKAEDISGGYIIKIDKRASPK